MKTKFLLTVFVAIVLVGGMAFATNTVSANTACDSAYVTQLGNVITVEPTSVDDTANIQCAFDTAVTIGGDVKVQLASGTFHTAQIVVNNFHGTFQGNGMGKSVVTNLPNLYVTPEDVVLQPPSKDNPWPILISFLESDVTMSDLAFRISGENATQGWTIFGMYPPIIELSEAVAFFGGEANASVNRVLVEGEPMENGLLGYSLINGIAYFGYFDIPEPHRISGTFTVSESVFRNIGSASPVTAFANASILIHHNTYENVVFGLEVTDCLNSSFEFSSNKLDAVIGIDLYSAYFPEDSGCKYIVKNNIFRGEVGIAMEPNFGDGNECLLAGNNVQNVTGLGIFLGPETVGCTVLGGNNKTNVLDLGTGNVLVGVNNMGTGIGPTIRHLMKP